MKIAPLAEPASMNAPLKLFLKVIFIKLTPRFARNVAPVPMYAQSKQFTRSNRKLIINESSRP